MNVAPERYGSVVAGWQKFALLAEISHTIPNFMTIAESTVYTEIHSFKSIRNRILTVVKINHGTEVGLVR